MKIIRIKLNRLRNEEWFNFFTEFKTFVEQFTARNLNIEALFVVFLTLYQQADETIEKILKSAFTSIMVYLDSVRDSTFRGLDEAVKSAAHHYEPDRREAAAILKPLFSHYGNLAARPYNEETSAIYNFIQELRSSKYADAIARLDLNRWVDELERNNQEFENTVLERNQEIAMKTDLKMLDIRRQTDKCYLDIIQRIEAQILLQGDAAFSVFVKTLNANIERYSILINRRSGKKNEPDNELSEL
jgi:hypothetical protein